MNKSRCTNLTPDQKGYSAYNFISAKKIFSWFAITKALNGKYPIWANQFDIWQPEIFQHLEAYFYSLCFAFGLAENGCVVTKFEKDNPVDGAPEVFVNNPLSTNNPDSFWMKELDNFIVETPSQAINLVNTIKILYKEWNINYCKGDILRNIGLQNEPYFKYFNYPDFLTKDSGLIQIKKYAEINGCHDLISMFKEISEQMKIVKEEIYNLLVNEFKYFE